MSFKQKPLAIAIALTLTSASSFSQTNNELGAITIYGSRFQEKDNQTLPQSNIISSVEIQKSGLTNIADVLKKIGGLPIRQDLYGNTNATIDLGGFGDSADNNVVVLLDGIRISENEQAPARISLIPIEAIEQIEITRGGNSALYGDGANGGVINIISKKNLDSLNIVSAGIGSNNTYQSNLYTAKKFGDISASVFGETNNSKGYRNNNQTASQSGGSIIQWQPNQYTKAGIRLFVDEQRNNLPGTLPLTWLNNNSKAKQQSIYSEQYKAESSNITIFASSKIDQVEYAIDISERNKHTHWQYDKDACELSSSCSQAYPSNSFASVNSSSTTRQINPRVRIDDFLVPQNKLTLGMDWLDWQFSRDVPEFTWGPSNASNKHSTSGFYANSDWTINSNNRLIGGYRTEKFKQSKYYADISGDEFDSDHQRITSHNIQYIRSIESTQLYAKHGKNYRLPNADDNYQLANLWTLSNPLKPQTSIDNEFGINYKNSSQQYSLSYYKSSITNEIGYDEHIYGNGNYPSSRRTGIFASARQTLTAMFSLRAQIQTINSKILAGTYAGKSVPSIPEYTSSFGVETRFNAKEMLDLAYRSVGKSYASGDNQNNGFRTNQQHYVDMRYNLKNGSWDWTASINNLLDKKQYDYAVYKPNYLDLYQRTVYPTLGRNFSLTGRYVF
ncbi:TonB-dependent receptor [Polynucleobacter sp. MWH-Spelu-300-X4]|uniref:TonB-dependent receptor n=1 Tax=Polynucleobacter sp. MWH-Spelu-300-X4 TaxID=2689109 RepID=UPI001BFD9A75|nr:TonB-dependent receptor [Polynucleobacter sp. MWH-Spelu-300-X4]QWD80162.1 TonB-dependent receptor [Polynucleobacter sp. MWH-Spelu-300-X4]